MSLGDASDRECEAQISGFCIILFPEIAGFYHLDLVYKLRLGYWGCSAEGIFLSFCGSAPQIENACHSWFYNRLKGHNVICFSVTTLCREKSLKGFWGIIHRIPMNSFKTTNLTHCSMPFLHHLIWAIHLDVISLSSMACHQSIYYQMFIFWMRTLYK